MKISFGIIALFVGLSVQSFANPRIEEGRIDLKGLDHCIASPRFAHALSEATAKSNGYKVHMDYKIDRTYRTTSEKVQVTVVGRSEESRNPEVYFKSEFTASGINGCWTVTTSEVKTSLIDQAEFVNFEQ